MTARPAVLAVDVGGTSIKSALVVGTGDQVLARSTPTPAAVGPDAVVAAITSLVTEQLAAAGTAGLAPTAIGIVVPGLVDSDRGIARYAANLGWRDVPLRDRLQSDTGLPTALGHDVGAAGLAELRLGAARGAQDALILALGTGVAGVVVSGGTVIRGARGIAGEIGHIPVGDRSVRCSCGAYGCLEMFASARGLRRLYAERTGEDRSAAQIVSALPHDADARAAWRTVTQTLARGLVAACLLTDPERVVLAGGLARAGDALRDPVAELLAAGMPWREPVPVHISPFADRSGLIGAALLATEPSGQEHQA